MRSLTLCLLSFAGVAAFSSANDAVAPWTVDDVVKQERASSFQLSRDGSRAIWIKSTADDEKDRHVRTLMVTDVASGEHRPLTVGKSSISNATFSPSGRFVAFLSDRPFPEGEKGVDKDDAGEQIWRIDLLGGDARPIAAIPFGVSAFEWVAEDVIYLATRERRSRSEARAKKEKDDTIVVEADDAYADSARQLHRLEIEERKLTRLTEGRFPIDSFAVSPNGRFAAALRGQSPHAKAERDSPPQCLVIDLASRSEREIFFRTRNKPSRFAWKRDSTGFYAIAPRSTKDGETWGAIDVLFDVAVPGLDTRPIDVGHDWGVREPFVVLADGFLTGLCNGARPFTAIYRGDAAAPSRSDLEGAHAGRVLDLVKARDSDRVIYVTGGASDPDHVVGARLEGNRLVDEKEILRPNGGFSSRPLSRTEVIRWQGANDDVVEGILYYPHDHQEGRRHPLVLMTHGGPHGADLDRFSERWSNAPNLYAQRGAFVLKTNYHGSSDYGLEFGESIRERYYELELIDMFSGIRSLDERGLVDTSRMGLVGWSNGAILSIAALTHGADHAPGFDYSFKACAPGAGDVNWTSDYGTCSFGASFDDFYFGGPPWTHPERYLAKSPLFRAEEVTTPTIIFFGTKDRAVPTEQGWQWFRALNRVGKAPVRFLLFPDQPHGLEKLTHQRRKLQEELAWFDRYLFEAEPRGVDVVMEGSPLDVALKAAAFARSGDRLGVVRGDALIPETIPFDDVEVGRFEVTRAQWASFDATAGVPIHANHPVTEMTEEKAKRYLAWLSERTGDEWRLLTVAEFEELEKSKGPDENTLDAWAGYSPSLADARVLARDVIGLGVDVALRPVGTRPPGALARGGEKRLVFDVGGNAAELVAGPIRAEVRGGCAVMTPDDRLPGPTRVPPAFVGLRVARIVGSDSGPPLDDGGGADEGGDGD